MAPVDSADYFKLDLMRFGLDDMSTASMGLSHCLRAAQKSSHGMLMGYSRNVRDVCLNHLKKELRFERSFVRIFVYESGFRSIYRERTVLFGAN